MAAAADADPGFPWRAVRWCLESGGASGRHLTAVALAHKPRQAAGRVLDAALAFAPGGWARFSHDAERRLRDLGVGGRLRGLLGYDGPLLYVERAEAAAAAAFAGSGFERAAVVVAGAGGERADTTLAAADGRRLELLAQLDYPHGLWAICEAAAAAAGFDPLRLPALAPTGVPRVAAMLIRDLADIKADGSLRLDTGYFAFCASLEPASRRLSRLLAGQKPEDVAASLEVLAGDALSRTCAEARRLSGCADVCLAGPFARWPGLIERIRAETPGRLYAASGFAADAAVGAAISVWHRAIQRERVLLDEPGQLTFAAPARRASWAASLAALPVKLLLAAAYFLLLTPYSLVLRLLGREFLEERWSARSSYWKTPPKEGEGLVLGLRRRF